MKEPFANSEEQLQEEGDFNSAEAINLEGRLFFVETMDGTRGLIGLDKGLFAKLMALDMMDKQVNLIVSKTGFGIEYAQNAPYAQFKAGLYTIQEDGYANKPQIQLEPLQMQELEKRGFADGEKVGLRISKMPYSNGEKATYMPLNLKARGYTKEEV